MDNNEIWEEIRELEAELEEAQNNDPLGLDLHHKQEHLEGRIQGLVDQLEVDQT